MIEATQGTGKEQVNVTAAVTVQVLLGVLLMGAVSDLERCLFWVSKIRWVNSRHITELSKLSKFSLKE